MSLLRYLKPDYSRRPLLLSVFFSGAMLFGIFGTYGQSVIIEIEPDITIQVPVEGMPTICSVRPKHCPRGIIGLEAFTRSSAGVGLEAYSTEPRFLARIDDNNEGTRQPSEVLGKNTDEEAVAEDICINKYGFPDDLARRYCDDVDAAIAKDGMAIAACDKAVRALMEFRGVERGDYVISVGAIARSLQMSLEEADRMNTELVSDYAEKCLVRLDPASLPKKPSKEFWERILESSGTLHLDGGRKCGGVFAQGLLVTARHCLHFGDGRITTDLTGVSFITHSGQLYDKWFNAKIVSTPYYGETGRHENDRVTDDLVGISLDHLDPAPPQLGIREAGHGERLVLAAFNSELAQADRAAGDGNGRSLSFDTSWKCRVYLKNKSGCMAHACQSSDQSSGSPMFTEVDGLPWVSAIHFGSFFRARDNECSEINTNREIPNLAVSVKRLFPDSK